MPAKCFGGESNHYMMLRGGEVSHIQRAKAKGAANLPPAACCAPWTPAPASQGRGRLTGSKHRAETWVSWAIEKHHFPLHNTVIQACFLFGNFSFWCFNVTCKRLNFSLFFFNNDKAVSYMSIKFVKITYCEKKSFLLSEGDTFNTSAFCS